MNNYETPTSHFENLSEVANELTRQQGVMTMVMWQLRDAYGAGRLGVNVRANLSDQLAGLGVKHIPKSLPDNQMAYVRLYKAGSPAGRLIDAVLGMGEDEDQMIRDAVESDAQQVLNKVKELVCS